MQAAETKAPEGKLVAVKDLKSESKKKMFIFILTFFCYIVLHYIYIYNYYTIFKSYVTHKLMNIMPEKQAALGGGFLY